MFYSFNVASMYIETLSTRISGRVHKCVLLRESFRVGKKVKHRTIANLTKCSEEEITAIRLALKHKEELPKIDFEKLNCGPQILHRQCLHVGAIFALHEVAKKIGITSSLGDSRQAILALWQVLARVINQGSRLSAVRLASKHAVCDVLGLDSFTEDHLYSNLNWLAASQKSIETELFSQKKNSVPVHIFLYDVTSSYLEGDCNEYAEWGYNRDKKRGKKQIVIGLLTDSEGDPLSAQVFRGNTSDNKTIEEQIKKVLKQFGIKRPIFVGDRGMFKGPQIKKIGKRSSHVSALTLPQIRTLMDDKVINLNMFQGEKIHTVHHKEYRYILRRNPMRQQEIENNRNSKLQAIDDLLQEKNALLKESKARIAKAAKKAVCAKIKKLGLHKWLSVTTKTRTLSLKVDEEPFRTAKELDGCYVIRTNVKESPETTSDIIHSRYKDLAFVETAFRTMKTAHLEVRPHYVRKSTSTEGHVFVVMLAYKIIRHLREAWRDIEVTVEEGIEELSSICFHMEEKNGLLGRRYIPEPRPLGQRLLDALNVKLPVSLPDRGVNVSPRKQLRRQQARKPGQPQDTMKTCSSSM